MTRTIQVNLTYSTLATEISSAFSGADANDVSVFYIATHGGYIKSSNTSLLALYNGTYITANQLRALLDPIKGRKIVIISACNSGQFVYDSVTQEMVLMDGDINEKDEENFLSGLINVFPTAKDGEDSVSGNNYYVMASSDKEESSYATENYSLFPLYFGYGAAYDISLYSVLSSLSADTNNDYIVTMNEMATYVQGKLNQQSLPGSQTVLYSPANSTFPIFALR